MKAYLIDPHKREITQVEYDGNWKSIAPMIHCRLFDLVILDDETRDGVFVDDEGLFVENQKYFFIEGFHQLFAGYGLVLGIDDEGESVEPKLSLEEVQARIRFHPL